MPSSLESDELDAEVSRLASSGIHIPAQPRVVQEVTHALLSGDCDLREVSELIAQDAGLTAMLYRISSSAAFARARPPQSIDQILALVGLRQCATLVQAYGVTTAFKGPTRNALEQFWSRARHIGELSMLISHERRRNGAASRVQPDQAYMIGIFHDVGIPILMQRFPEYCSVISTRPGSWLMVGEEDRTFNVDHSSIGYLMARHWRLPDLIADAILYHHSIPEIQAPPVRVLTSILSLATHFYSQMHGLIGPDWQTESGIVLETLCIAPSDLPIVREEVLDLFVLSSGASAA